MRDLRDLAVCRSMRTFALLAALACLTAASVASHADAAPVASTFALDLSGVRFGSVRAIETRDRLVLATQDMTPALASLLDAFHEKKTLKRDVRLTSGAVMRKANDARLLSMKLPAIGGGGPAEVELTFAVTSLTQQPLLSAKESPPPPPAAHIASFRIDLTGMPAFETPKLDAITLAGDEIAFEVAAGGAPPFASWKRAASPTRAAHIEYVAADGRVLLQLRFDHCKPSSVTPLGANGTTRIALSCPP